MFSARCSWNIYLDGTRSSRHSSFNLTSHAQVQYFLSNSKFQPTHLFQLSDRKIPFTLPNFSIQPLTFIHKTNAWSRPLLSSDLDYSKNPPRDSQPLISRCSEPVGLQRKLSFPQKPSMASHCLQNKALSN